MNSKNLCPICGDGHLHEQVDQVEVDYGGEKSLRNSLFSVCDTCGSETATVEQVRSNKRDTIDFRKRVDGKLVLKDQVSWEESQTGELRPVFRDGKLLVDDSFSEIRNRLWSE